MLTKQSPEIGAAVEKLLYVSADEKMRVACELREKAERDYYSGLATAKALGYQQGAAQEREKVVEEMRQEREKVVEEMRQERKKMAAEMRQEREKVAEEMRQEREKVAEEMRQEREKMAAGMKREGMEDETIARITGLPIEAVREL